MKKKKFRLLLNIATICLCVAAIAFGVYSAKNASLNVSGTIGFEAHNVKATISAQIKGDGVTNDTASADGAPRTDYATIGNTVNLIGTETEANKPALALSKFYFSDMGESGTPADIYLKISVTNNSAFNIKVYFDVPNITGVTTTIGEDSSSYVKLGTTNSDKSGYIVLKLSLNANDSGDYDDLKNENNLNLTMHLEKYEDYYVKTITESVYNGSAFEPKTTSRLCTQLGHGTQADLNGAEFKQLEWYAFAVKGLDTGKGYMYNNKFYAVGGTETETESKLEDRWYTLYGVNVNNDLTITVNGTNKSLKGHQLWFIQQYTVGGGYMEDAKYNFATGKMFKADYSKTTGNTYANGTTYQSDIYKYLNNDISNKCDDRTENNTFILDTGIYYDKHYKSTISVDTNKRTVSETDTTVSGSTIVNNNFTSTFWLLNYTELGLAYNKSLGQSDYGNVVKNFSIGKTDGVEANNTVYGANWWLRSPYASLYNVALYVSSHGLFSGHDVNYSSIGVRAAFQIQI